MSKIKFSIIVIVERPDGSIFRQRIKKVEPEEEKDRSLISKEIRSYKKILGRGYLILDWYIGY